MEDACIWSCNNHSTHVDNKNLSTKLSTSCLQVVYKVVYMVGGGFWFLPRALLTLRSRCKWLAESAQTTNIVNARIGSVRLLPTCSADVTLVTSVLMLHRLAWKPSSDYCVRVLSRPGSTCASTAMTLQWNHTYICSACAPRTGTYTNGTQSLWKHV